MNGQKKDMYFTVNDQSSHVRLSDYIIISKYLVFIKLDYHQIGCNAKFCLVRQIMAIQQGFAVF